MRLLETSQIENLTAYLFCHVQGLSKKIAARKHPAKKFRVLGGGIWLVRAKGTTVLSQILSFDFGLKNHTAKPHSKTDSKTTSRS